MKKSICSVKGCPFEGKYCRVHLQGSLAPVVAIKKASKERAKINRKEYGPKARAFVAKNPICQIGVEGECTKMSVCVHHMKGKDSMEDLLNEKYWMASCARCNNWIEQNDAVARNAGWKLSKHKNYKRSK